MKASTGQHYRKRIGQVIDYIYQHLDRDLDVNTLADVALMSPYHFHRIYREIAQETVNTTVRRLRLQYAAAELIRSETSLANIATKVAYGSTEAFIRAFDKQFGETPQAYRQRRRDLSLPVESFVAMLPEVNKEHTAMYEVEMIEVKPLQLLGYEHRGDYMNIGQAFEKLFMDASTQGLVNDKTRSIGIYYDDPKSVPQEKLRSAACISVPDNATYADNGMKRLSLPGGRCATVFTKSLMRS